MENKDAEDELFDRLTVRNNIEEKIIYLFYLNRQLM